MRGAVVYESMFGSTRIIAEAIAKGLHISMDMSLVNASDAREADVGGLDLVVVGAPTHAHGLPRPMTRNSAPSYIDKQENELVLEARANSAIGVREWLDSLGKLHIQSAAFDTRVKGSPLVTGRASRGIAKSLAAHGLMLVTPAESFLVDARSKLLPGEVARATAWGEWLGTLVLLNLTSTS